MARVCPMVSTYTLTCTQFGQASGCVSPAVLPDLYKATARYIHTCLQSLHMRVHWLSTDGLLSMRNPPSLLHRLEPQRVLALI